MGKPLIEVENPMILERPDRIPHHFDRPIEWVPVTRCECGCNHEILEGCIYDKDNGWYYFSPDCVIKHMSSIGSFEIIDYATHKEAV